MSDKPLHMKLRTEDLALYAVGLADDDLVAEVQRAAASDAELAAMLGFIRADAAADLEDERSVHTDHRDPLAHPADRELGRRLREVLEGGDEEALSAVFCDLMLLYGGHAKILLGRTFPQIRDVRALLEKALMRMAADIAELDEANDSLRIWFLTAVHREAIALLKREAQEDFTRRKEELSGDCGLPADEEMTIGTRVV